MAWLGKWLGNSESPGQQVDERGLRDELSVLDKARPGLAAETLRYVLSGENDSVLLTLGQIAQGTAQVSGIHGWWNLGPWVKGHSDFLVTPCHWQPGLVRRYAQYLSAVRGISHYPFLPGTDRSPDWFRISLWEYRNARINLPSKKSATDAHPEPLSVDQLVAVLAAEGEALIAVLDIAFERSNRDWQARQIDAASPELMPGFDDFLRSDPPARSADIAALSAQARAYGLRSLARRGFVDGVWFDLAFNQASDSSKLVRAAAIVLLSAADPDILIDRARNSFPNMKAPQKISIANAIATTRGEKALHFLKQATNTEKNANVRSELERLVQQKSLSNPQIDARVDGAHGFYAVDGMWVDAPPPTALPLDVPVSADLRALIDTALDIWRKENERYNREQRGQRWFKERGPLPRSATGRCCSLLGPGAENVVQEAGDSDILRLFQRSGLSKEQVEWQAKILAHPDLTLWHLLRALGAESVWSDMGRSPAIFWTNAVTLAIRARLTDGLRTLSDACNALGEPHDGTIRYLFSNFCSRHNLDDWQPEHLWPYFLCHFNVIDEALDFRPLSTSETRKEIQAFDLLAFFPKTPARYLSGLIERAIGDRKAVRRPARDLLNSASHLDDLLLPLLEHPKQEARVGAAGWLAERKSTASVLRLRAAAKKEKNVSVRAAFLDALARLGTDISSFISAETLLQEAQSSLKQLMPKELDWFPYEAMPTLRRADGSLLDPIVLRSWVVLAAKLKQPGWNPWFELLLDQLDPSVATTLGCAILKAWIAYDTVRWSDAEANEFARSETEARRKSHPNWTSDDIDQIFMMLRTGKLREYRNSGNSTKGILALAIRATGSEAVTLARGYFRDHYSRTAQCKALLECLAANPAPAATQFILSVASRWRTRTIQEAAAGLVQAIADRRGWTAEQLGDRTIPTAGFDADGILPLPAGDRIYTVRIDGQGRLQLYNPDGKAVQGLPSPSGGEKNDTLQAAKLTLSAARKEVKGVFQFQAKRFYDALCCERVWPIDEWSEHLLRHPLARWLVQRLIWLGLDNDGNTVSAFRPLEDLTLSDASDTSVDVGQFAQVRLAHRALLTPNEADAWRAHFRDYKVEPLFEQLDRPLLVPDAAQDTTSQIEDRHGWLIDAFKLRTVATKLGYTRGAVEDGGVFATYQKHFDILRIAAVVEFTGNSLPEENRLTALLGLQFLRMGKDGAIQLDRPICLRDVPRILLSETWNDFHTIAASGAGYAADWEKRTAW